MSTKSSHLKNGRISAYGLALGYIDRVTRVTESGKTWHIDLSFNGLSYDINVYPVGQKREWVLSNGHRVLAGWAQFDKLGDARRFHRHLAAITTKEFNRTTGDVYAECLATLYTKEVSNE